jgi:16S rRNA (guanine527-N7)-methyltransferase
VTPEAGVPSLDEVAGLLEEARPAFESYRRLLLEWNQRFNLTRITDPDEVWRKHFLDSLTCLQAFPWRGDEEVVDVGTGAGFPGVPLRLVCPRLRLTLVEATGKKVRFLEALLAELGLRDAKLLHARAEDLPRQQPALRFEITVARAIGPLWQVAAWSLPLLRGGGRLIAQKGRWNEDLDRGLEILPELGGEVESVRRLDLPGGGEQRHLVVIRKLKPSVSRESIHRRRRSHRPKGAPASL